MSLRIAHGRDHARRLVQHHKGLRLGRLEVTPIHFNVVASWVHARPQFADHPSVDGDTALGDQSLGLTPGGQPRFGNHFLQPDLHT